MSESEGSRSITPSRRSVVKGAAWAVPAVVVASAAPAMAASQCLTATFGGVSCKQPGAGNNWAYRLQICFTNTCDTSVTVFVKTIQGNTGNAKVQDVNQTIVVPNDGVAHCGTAVIYCSSNSANFINVTYTVNGGADQVDQLPSPVQTCTDAGPLCP